MNVGTKIIARRGPPSGSGVGRTDQPGQPRPAPAVRVDAPVLNVVSSVPGVRELRASVVQLALDAKQSPERPALLVIERTRLSAQGLRDNWDELIAVLVPELTARMGLVARVGAENLVLPDTDALRTLGAELLASDAPAPLRRVDRSFEVLRVLLARWLLRRGRLAVGELGRLSGLSHPSVTKSLRALGDALVRKPDRSVLLNSLPNPGWAKLLANSTAIRQPARYHHPSGAVDTEQLLRRLAQLAPRGVAIGGAAAAHHWVRQLPLIDLPHVDLSVHAPDGAPDNQLVRALNLGLVPARRDQAPLLVLHAVPRAELLLAPDTLRGLPVADPVEALLDLYEHGQTPAAEALLGVLSEAAERGPIRATATSRPAATSRPTATARTGKP
jgi:hypothetical protein